MAENGMVDLSDLVGAAHPSAGNNNNNSINNNQQYSRFTASQHECPFARAAEAYGMVSMSEYTMSGLSHMNTNNKKRGGNSSSNQNACLALDKHSEILTASTKAITLASSLALNSPNSEEKALWTLFSAFLEDAERAISYAPEQIGINLEPIGGSGTKNDDEDSASSLQTKTSFAPTRLWYVTHYAFIQDLLMRHPSLRAVALLLRWLENTFADQNEVHYSAIRFSGRARTVDETRLMREVIRSTLRAGRLDEAIRTAEAADDAVTACMLSAAQMKTHPEGWNTRTAVVPLFGEYARGDEPAEWGKGCTGANVGHQGSCDSAQTVGDSWTSNAERIDHLGTLFEWAQLPDVEADESAIAAVLSGNEDILKQTFASSCWRDEVWVAARCGLVKIFTKAISSNGEPVASGPFRTGFETYCPPVANWVEIASNKLVSKIIAICEARLTLATTHQQQQRGGSCATVSSPLTLPEDLQIRLVLHTLMSAVTASSRGAASSSSTSSSHGQPFYPTSSPLFEKMNAISSSHNNNNNSAMLLRAAVNVVTMRAFADRLFVSDPQRQIRRRSTEEPCECRITREISDFSKAIGAYCISVLTTATGSHQPAVTASQAHLQEAARRCCQLLFMVTDAVERGTVAAKIVLAARCAWIAAFSSSTVSNEATLSPSSSPAIITGNVSPSSRVQQEERRLHASGQEQWLLQLFRRYNASRFGINSDSVYVKALLESLYLGVYGDDRQEVSTAGNLSPSTAYPRLASSPHAESQMWRIALWASPAELSKKKSAATGNGSSPVCSSSSGDGSSGVDSESLRVICSDICNTMQTLWRVERDMKAITEVTANYNKYIRPLVDRLGGDDLTECGVLGPLRLELAFWTYFSNILVMWDVLSTIAVHTAEAARDKCFGQLEAYTSETNKLREAVRVQSSKALALQKLVISHSPSCAGAVLKCVELHINATVVCINANQYYSAALSKQSVAPSLVPPPVVTLCQFATQQVSLIHEAIELAERSDAADLFASYRMLRLDAGISKLRTNVAAALE